MSDQIKNIFKKAAALFTKKRLPYILIVLFVLISTAANFAPTKTPPPYTNIPVYTPPLENTSPGVASTSGEISIINYDPINDSLPNIAGTAAPISITLNKSLSNTQISDFLVASIPEMNFRTIMHVNRKTIFFQPYANWSKDTKYLIILNSPLIKTFSFSFTPTDRTNPKDVISGPENL